MTESRDFYRCRACKGEFRHSDGPPELCPRCGSNKVRPFRPGKSVKFTPFRRTVDEYGGRILFAILCVLISAACLYAYLNVNANYRVLIVDGKQVRLYDKEEVDSLATKRLAWGAGAALTGLTALLLGLKVIWKYRYFRALAQGRTLPGEPSGGKTPRQGVVIELEEYASRTGRDSADVLADVQAGRLSGFLKQGQWYIDQ